MQILRPALDKADGKAPGPIQVEARFINALQATIKWLLVHSYRAILRGAPPTMHWRGAHIWLSPKVLGSATLDNYRFIALYTLYAKLLRLFLMPTLPQTHRVTYSFWHTFSTLGAWRLLSSSFPVWLWACYLRHPPSSHPRYLYLSRSCLSLATCVNLRVVVIIITTFIFRALIRRCPAVVGCFVTLHITPIVEEGRQSKRKGWEDVISFETIKVVCRNLMYRSFLFGSGIFFGIISIPYQNKTRFSPVCTLVHMPHSM